MMPDTPLEEGIDGDQQQEAAFDQQDHGFQMPEPELEAVVAFLGDQPGRDQHQYLDEGSDQREKTVEQGLGAALLPALAALVMVHYGWRTAYQVLGALSVLVSWPVAFWLLRDAGTDQIGRAHV